MIAASGRQLRHDRRRVPGLICTTNFQDLEKRLPFQAAASASCLTVTFWLTIAAVEMELPFLVIR